jgi:LmbE family N-acetylglucosaminyl deacetylase
MEIISADRLCFMFAHPDDDTLIAGTMRMLIRAGKEVHGIWTACDRLYGRLGNRLKELKTATGLLGLPPERVHVLKFRDLGILRQLDEAADAIAGLLSSIRPDSVTANAFEGGHPDHDVVNFLAYEAVYRAGISPRLFEFPLYNGAGPFLHWRWQINRFPDKAGNILHVPLDSDALKRKYEMMQAYWSQWMYMLPARLACPPVEMTQRGEPYRACPPDRDHTSPPHAGPLNYERWFCRWMGIRFEDYRQAVWAASKRL